MNIVNKFKQLFPQEFDLKIDSYYFDVKLNQIIVIIKIKNKRYFQKFQLDEILINQQLLQILHPIDLCLLGVLANMNKTQLDSQPIIAPDLIVLIKLSSFLKISEISYNENGEEIAIITPIFINRPIKINFTNLYKQKELLNAIKYSDAIKIGTYLTFDNVVREKLKINYLNLYLINIHFILLLISCLLQNMKLNISLFTVRGSLVILPFIIYIQNYIIVHFINKNFLEFNFILLSLFFIYLEIISKIDLTHTIIYILDLLVCCMLHVLIIQHMHKFYEFISVGVVVYLIFYVTIEIFCVTY